MPLAASFFFEKKKGSEKRNFYTFVLLIMLRYRLDCCLPDGARHNQC